MKIFTKKQLSKNDLRFLSDEIAKTEKNTSGEIRIVIRHRRRLSERKLTIQELALKEFYSLGMHNTKYRTGVLIYLLLAERKFQILADKGINEKVSQDTWDRMAKSMMCFFKDGKLREGLHEAIMKVGIELAKHFPLKKDDINELPNDVVES